MTRHSEQDGEVAAAQQRGVEEGIGQFVRKLMGWLSIGPIRATGSSGKLKIGDWAQVKG